MPDPLWNFAPPPESPLTDHAVPQTGNRLEHRRIALLLTGSIAAYRAPDLVRDLRRQGADVYVIATQDALRYVAREALEWTSLHPVYTDFSADAEHLSDHAPYDAFLLAPATYNVLNKFALGIADDLLTSMLSSALGRHTRDGTPILTVPTMHGTMHNAILTETLQRLHQLGVTVLPPRQENGKNNLPANEVLVAHVIRALSEASLRGRKLLLTGGPTPVRLDNVRLLTNRFTGGLAIEIAREAWFQQAHVHLILGQGSLPTPPYLPAERVPDYDAYRAQVNAALTHFHPETAIFSAAVADYKPAVVFDGKLPSGRNWTLKLEPTPKVIQEVRDAHPHLRMVTFKYEEHRTHEELMHIARERAQRYQLVVANRGEEFLEAGDQVAWIVEGDTPAERIVGKPQIAQALLRRVAAWN